MQYKEGKLFDSTHYPTDPEIWTIELEAEWLW